MKKSIKIILIVVILVLEFAWATQPSISLHGAILDESYRHDERFATLVAWSDHPSPETKVAFDAEVKLLNEHMARRQVGIWAVVLAIDAVGIYYLLRHTPKTTTG